MDFLTMVGVAVALAAILGGQVLEGGCVGSILQLTAFMIVTGGTLGAICVQNPLPVVLKSVSLLSLALFNPKSDTKQAIARIVDQANLSWKQGLLALEGESKITMIRQNVTKRVQIVRSFEKVLDRFHLPEAQVINRAAGHDGEGTRVSIFE